MRTHTMKSRMALLAMAAVVAVALGAHRSSADDKKEFKATCPMSGKACKEASSVDYKGKKVYFCCDGCPEAFKKDPSAVQAKVMLQWLETGQITQVACPVS